ncbi:MULTISPECIES: hypothetical protein [unclassified Empedobacter]|nr:MULTISPECIES: hypothetical protein [unclassified Empedobacter]
MKVKKIFKIKKKQKTPFPKTKLARCTGKGVAFKTNVELKNLCKIMKE